MQPSLLTKLREFRYWYITRYTSRFIPWVARKLPKKIKYFVVIDGMVTVEPNKNPHNVTGMEMLTLWGPINKENS